MGGNKINGAPAVDQLAELVPASVTNPSVDGSSDENGSGDGTNKHKKKNLTTAAADKNKSKSGKTYDYANQYVDRLLGSGNPPKQ